MVDALNGNDNNAGVSSTGGPGDLVWLDFGDAYKTIGKAASVRAGVTTLIVSLDVRDGGCTCDASMEQYLEVIEKGSY